MGDVLRRLPLRSPLLLGAVLAVGAMLGAQLGLGASVGLIDDVGPASTAALRLLFAGAILLVIVRPRPSAFTRRSLAACVALGVVTAGITMAFTEALARIPLGTASALEFLGPLAVALLRGGPRVRVWALLAALGVALLTNPWQAGLDPAGVAFALAAAAGWAALILLTQYVGDQLSGVTALAVSIPVAAVVATAVAGPELAGHLDAGRLDAPLLLTALGVALLLPLAAFSLELLALRRLSAAAFGTLAALEPALALGVGFVMIGQVPTVTAIAGVAAVVIAGLGAARAGSRVALPVPAEPPPVAPPEPTSPARPPAMPVDAMR